jgi:hypothetical protein
MELYSHNEVQYSLRSVAAVSSTSLKCTITNNSNSDLNFTDKAILASARSSTSLNSIKTAAEEKESIDEEIINENVLIDPHADKKFSYKDCEINPKLDSKLRAKLQKLLKDHKAAFTTLSKKS